MDREWQEMYWKGKLIKFRKGTKEIIIKRKIGTIEIEGAEIKDYKAIKERIETYYS